MATPHFVRALEGIKSSVISVATVAEEQLQQAIAAVRDKDTRLANRVIERDKELDQMEVDLEEECLKMLALYQPVARDLRFVVSVLKINNDLERIGDLAANIGERCISICTLEQTEFPYDVDSMAELAGQAVKLSIDALIQADVKTARDVIAQDKAINKMHQQHYSDIRDAIRKEPTHTEFFLQFLSFSRYLERVGDLATNIAEDVIYLVDGHIVRHSKHH